VGTAPDRDHLLQRWVVSFLVGLVAAVGVGAASTAPLDATKRVGENDAAAAVIARYRARIPDLMADQGIPEFAVALVDEDKTLWVEGFGDVDRRGSASVNADTIFSVQSMSKLFTATAVMQAVAAGRLDLDTSTTTPSRRSSSR
jgi:CubicO group peptidase (beta-lactamase class C family)